MKAGSRARVLGYLAAVHLRNPDAEVSGHELAHELGLAMEDVRRCVDYLASEGLVSAEVFPVNTWVRITDEGLRLAELEG